MSIQLDFAYTNNQAKYKTLVIGLEILIEIKVKKMSALIWTHN